MTDAFDETLEKAGLRTGRERERTDLPMGNLQSSQGPKKLEGRVGSTGNRYQCDNCEHYFMSDESLQIHKLGHLLASFIYAIDRLREEGIPMRLVPEKSA